MRTRKIIEGPTLNKQVVGQIVEGEIAFMLLDIKILNYWQVMEVTQHMKEIKETLIPMCIPYA